MPLEETLLIWMFRDGLSDYFFADKTTRTETRISAKPKEDQNDETVEIDSWARAQVDGPDVFRFFYFFTDGGRNHFFVVKLMTAGR